MILTFNPHWNFWNIQTFHETRWCEKKFFFLACFSFLEQKTMTKNYLGKKRVSWLALLPPIHHRGKSWQELKPSPRQELERMLLTGGGGIPCSSHQHYYGAWHCPFHVALPQWADSLFSSSLKTMSRRHAQRPIEQRWILQLRPLLPGLSSYANFTKIALHSSLEETHLKHDCVIL